ncbi:MAG TPA: ParB/RepB/Spo0J family partition protein [Tissierellaceae bacterium]
MSNVKKGLGRGLSALIKDNNDMNLDFSDKKIINIKLEDIRVNKNQPRQTFNEKNLEELALSIKEFGVIQPILVRKIDNTNIYEIIAGERRYRASVKAGLKEIPAIVTDIDKLEQDKIAIIENIQREDLNPIEEAKAYKNLIEKYKLTQLELSKTLGKSRSYIANSMRILNLDKIVLEYLENEKLTMGHCKVLLSLNKIEQVELANKIINEGLNVRQTEELVKRIKNKDEDISPKKKTTRKDPYLKEIQNEFMGIFGTKVDIKNTGKVKKIEIEYYSDDDLQRIYEIIKG